MKFNVCTNNGEQSSVTVFFGSGVSSVATKDHPNFDRIIEALEDGNDDASYIHDLFDVGVAIGRQFEQLSERVSVNHGKVFFDGVEVDDVLTQQIVRFYSEGNDDFRPLVAFFEKIAQNPSEHSREHLFSWLSHNQFGFHPDGDIIAYKGVHNDRSTSDNPAGDLLSSNSGRALVNGEVVRGQIPNNPGTVITMPRDEVEFSPSRGCSTGLHVANFSFAKGFANVVIQVKVNPRDVVSVPVDSDYQKMRVCRYRVLKVVTAEDAEVLHVADPEKTAVFVQRPAPKAKSKRGGVSRLLNRKRPKYYEEFTLADFRACPRWELRQVAGTWEISQGRSKDVLCEKLAKEAKKRKRTWR